MVIPEERHNKEQRIDTLLSRAEALQGLEEYEEAVRCVCVCVCVFVCAEALQGLEGYEEAVGCVCVCACVCKKLRSVGEILIGLVVLVSTSEK